MTFSFPERPTARLGLLPALALALFALLLPAAGFAQSDTTQLEARINAARNSYNTQLQSLTAQRARFDAYLGQLETLTAARAEASTLANDEAVRDSRRVAREMALALQNDSEQLRALLDEIRSLESDLLGALDERQQGLEAELASTPAGSGERAALMAELVELSELRARHLEPLAPLPEVSLDEILLGLEDETTPEELLATADELLDHERRLQEHMREVERHIRQLRLREQDRAFRSEASLFEEGQNSGRREERSTTGGGAAADSEGASNDGRTETPTQGGSDSETDIATQGGGSPDPGGVGATDVPPTAGTPDDGAMSGEFTDGDGGARTDETDNGPVDDGLTSGAEGQTPGFGTDFEPTPSAPSLFGTTTSVQDPTQLIMLNTEEGRPGDTERSTHRRLQSLEQELESTERTLREVREERQRLLDRVDDLEAQEGF